MLCDSIVPFRIIESNRADDALCDNRFTFNVRFCQRTPDTAIFKTVCAASRRGHTRSARRGKSCAALTGKSGAYPAALIHSIRSPESPRPHLPPPRTCRCKNARRQASDAHSPSRRDHRRAGLPLHWKACAPNQWQPLREYRRCLV